MSILKLNRRTIEQAKKHHEYWLRRGYNAFVEEWCETGIAPQYAMPGASKPPIRTMHVSFAEGWSLAKHHFIFDPPAKRYAHKVNDET